MDEQTTTTPPPEHEETSDYRKGYDFGIVCDAPGFQREYDVILLTGGNSAEYTEGWMDGVLDGQLNSLRGELRSIVNTQARVFLIAAMFNLVGAFKTGTNNEQS